MKRTSLSWITVIPFCNSNEYTAASFTDWKLFVPGLFAVYQMGCKMQTTFLYGVLSFTCGGQTTFLHHSELHLWMFPAARSFIWVTSRPLAALGRKKKQSKRQISVPHHALPERVNKLCHGMLVTENGTQEATEPIPPEQGRGHGVSAAESVLFFAIPVSVLLIKHSWFPCGSLWHTVVFSQM